MIESIQIKESPVFEHLQIDLHTGLNVFSGASGSGKSVFMESLLAIFGIKDSNAKSLQAILSNLKVDLEDYDLQNEEEIILSITKKDKTRYNLQGNFIAKKTLQELLSPVIKHISLKNATELLSENILNTFDNLIKNQDPSYQDSLLLMQENYKSLKEVKQQYQALLEKEKNIQDLKDLATFEIKQITNINPKLGEYEELIALKKTLSKKEKIQEKIQNALQAFEHLDNIQTALDALEIDLPHFYDSIYEAKGILEDQENKILSLDEINPEELLQRLSDLALLNQRYGSIESAINHLHIQEQKLKDYENISFNKEKLLKQQDVLSNKCHLIAKDITAYREKFLPLFLEKLQTLCTTLKLQTIQIILQESILNSTGTQEIQLKLHNTPIQNLSTGEYNRLRLAIMCLNSDFNHNTGILVLDEIDANLSGEESEGVAKILKKLSSSYQIFAISHQPHLPALADTHYLVYKEGQKSQIKILDTSGKIQEIARMISGSNITQEALDFAKKRLGL
ncbi:AAA family ATPase [Helicobacter anatolicus]|uniref:AAA family ATPase n=1 Tax=Helicobacter anatolicus TaxID=2905874 RepID=UPI001E2BDF25|nr:AAA family ATPase [Helicobacter anatolicus]MCE3038141.1 AAA family ATPase [Helicobacter anatolicus]